MRCCTNTGEAQSEADPDARAAKQSPTKQSMEHEDSSRQDTAGGDGRYMMKYIARHGCIGV